MPVYSSHDHKKLNMNTFRIKSVIIDTKYTLVITSEILH